MWTVFSLMVSSLVTLTQSIGEILAHFLFCGFAPCFIGSHGQIEFKLKNLTVLCLRLGLKIISAKLCEKRMKFVIAETFPRVWIKFNMAEVQYGAKLRSRGHWTQAGPGIPTVPHLWKSEARGALRRVTQVQVRHIGAARVLGIESCKLARVIMGWFSDQFLTRWCS